MKTQSAKAKGRRLQQYVVKKILETFSNLSNLDVQSRAMGSQGTDVMLSKIAQDTFGFSVECKNRETNKGIYDAYDQAISNCDNTWPLVVLGMNNRPPLAILKFDTFMTLAKAYYEQSKI